MFLHDYQGANHIFLIILKNPLKSAVIPMAKARGQKSERLLSILKRGWAGLKRA
jgi:hypothetical protein